GRPSPFTSPPPLPPTTRDRRDRGREMSFATSLVTLATRADVDWTATDARSSSLSHGDELSAPSAGRQATERLRSGVELRARRAARKPGTRGSTHSTASVAGDEQRSIATQIGPGPNLTGGRTLSKRRTEHCSYRNELTDRRAPDARTARGGAYGIRVRG